MTSVSTYDFRNDMAKYIAMASSGTKIVLKKFNKPVAILSSYKEPNFEKFFGFRENTETTSEYMKRVRRSKREAAWVKRYASSR